MKHQLYVIRPQSGRQMSKSYFGGKTEKFKQFMPKLTRKYTICMSLFVLHHLKDCALLFVRQGYPLPCCDTLLRG